MKIVSIDCLCLHNVCQYSYDAAMPAMTELAAAANQPPSWSVIAVPPSQMELALGEVAPTDLSPSTHVQDVLEVVSRGVDETDEAAKRLLRGTNPDHRRIFEVSQTVAPALEYAKEWFGGTRTVAQTTDQAIRSGALPIEVRPRAIRNHLVTPVMRGVLMGIGEGGANINDLAMLLDEDPKAVEVAFAALYRLTGARSTPSLIRIGYT